MRAAATVVLLLLAATPAAAQVPGVPADALGGRGDQHVDYPRFESTTHAAPGMSAGSVGDVNGDGKEDFAAGFATWVAANPVYVTFSSRLPTAGSALGLGGFRVDVPRYYGHGLAGAGDIDGDGLGEVAIMASRSAVVVFGKRDAATVDTTSSEREGFFVVTGVGNWGATGSETAHHNDVVPLGDVNGDGVPDLLFAAYGDAAIVYPPRDAEGMTIDATVAGPHVGRIEPAEPGIETTFVDRFGDVDGDGRVDVLVAGELRDSTDQVAYGLRAPPPGVTVDPAAAVDGGAAFELRTHDGTAGSWGELEAALTIGDQNGDAIRDVGMVGRRDARRILRVAYAPPFGTRRDIHDLSAADGRGYAMDAHSDVIDAGDQNGDGRADLATSKYVHFTDPARENGWGQPGTHGFGFDFPGGGGTVAAPIADLNRDGKPELVVARVMTTDNGSAGGQKATYAVDVFDSAGAPVVEQPEVPYKLPGGRLEVPARVDSGAGARGAGSLPVKAFLEVRTAAGALVATAAGRVGRGTSKRVALRARARLGRGRRYRARYAFANGRGLHDVSPWRTFTAASARAKPRRRR